MTTLPKSSFVKTYLRVAAHNYIELDTLAAPANVKQFVEEMLAHLVNQRPGESAYSERGPPINNADVSFYCNCL